MSIVILSSSPTQTYSKTTLGASLTFCSQQREEGESMSKSMNDIHENKAYASEYADNSTRSQPTANE